MQVAFFLAGEITQVKESIPWVRCASGNVYSHLPPPAAADQTMLHNICNLSTKALTKGKNTDFPKNQIVLQIPTCTCRKLLRISWFTEQEFEN